MGNMIGILSTVILVSTLATLIFAVGAYVIARRRREAVPLDEDEPAPREVEPALSPLEEPPKPAAPAPLPPQPKVQVEEEPRGKPAKAKDVFVSAPDRPRPSRTDSDEPLFRRLTLPGEATAKAQAQPAEEKREQNWE